MLGLRAFNPNNRFSWSEKIPSNFNMTSLRIAKRRWYVIPIQIIHLISQNMTIDQIEALDQFKTKVCTLENEKKEMASTIEELKETVQKLEMKKEELRTEVFIQTTCRSRLLLGISYQDDPVSGVWR